MSRGISGTYVYACDAALREYLKQHIPAYWKVQPLRFLSPEEASENRKHPINTIFRLKPPRFTLREKK